MNRIIQMIYDEYYMLFPKNFNGRPQSFYYDGILRTRIDDNLIFDEVAICINQNDTLIVYEMGDNLSFNIHNYQITN